MKRGDKAIKSSGASAEADAGGKEEAADDESKRGRWKANRNVHSHKDRKEYMDEMRRRDEKVLNSLLPSILDIATRWWMATLRTGGLRSMRGRGCASPSALRFLASPFYST